MKKETGGRGTGWAETMSGTEKRVYGRSVEGSKTLMPPRRPQMLRQLQTSPSLSTPPPYPYPPPTLSACVVVLSGNPFRSRRRGEARRSTACSDLRARCRIPSCLQLFVFPSHLPSRRRRVQLRCSPTAIETREGRVGAGGCPNETRIFEKALALC